MLKMIKARTKLLEILMDAINQGFSWEDIKKLLEVKKTLKKYNRPKGRWGDRDSDLIQ